MSAPLSSPPRVAVAGLGGFALHVHRVLHHLEKEGVCKVVATCEPEAAKAATLGGEVRLTERNVRIFSGLEPMLEGMAGAVDAVFLPTPIHLHASMHRACVERGLPVYLEKPPTLWWQELEEMIAVEARATKPTEVGFNFITEPGRQALKQRLLAGEFGRLRSAGFLAAWARPAAYFSRNGWAGKLFLDGSPIPLLDSCVGNAMAHFVQNILFWAGPEQDGFGLVTEAQACLYRAYAIAGADTVFAEARTPEGVLLRLGATHACRPDPEIHGEFLVCENARIRYVAEVEAEINWNDGRREMLDLRAQGDHFERNFRRYFDYLRGRHPRPVNSMATCRPFVTLNDLLYLATPGITTVWPNDLEINEVHGKGSFRAIAGVRPALEEFVAQGAWPHARNLPWAREPHRAHLADLPLALPRIRALAGI